MRTGYVAMFAVLAALLLPGAARAQYIDCDSYVYYDGNELSGYSRTVAPNQDYVVGVESTLYDPNHQQMDQNSDHPLYFTWAEADVSEYPYQWDAWYSVEGRHWYWDYYSCWYGCWVELSGSQDSTYVQSTPPPPPPAQITVCPVPSPQWVPGSNSAVIGGSGFSGNTPQVSWSGNGGVNFLQSSSATVTSDTQIDLSVSLAPVTSDGSITLGVGAAACVIPVLAALSPPSCGDQRDQIIQEYLNWQVNLTPQCGWFNNGTAHSAYFTNGNLRPDELTYTWSLIKQPLTVAASSGYGLDRWVEIYMQAHSGAPSRAIASGYRSPNHNAQVSDYKQTSRHMHGDAIDMVNSSAATPEYWDLRNAAKDGNPNAGASWVEDLTGKCRLGCVHADWRNSARVYVQ